VFVLLRVNSITLLLYLLGLYVTLLSICCWSLSLSFIITLLLPPSCPGYFSKFIPPLGFVVLVIFGSLVFCLWTSAAASECIYAALYLRIELFWTSTNCTMMITDDDGYFWTML